MPVLDAACSCDSVPQSVHGIVENDETIVRVLTSKHYKSERVQTSAFRLQDIIENGVSLVRLGMTDVAEFTAVADDIRAAGNADDVRGAFVQKAKAIRDLHWPDGSRKLCLFDDPVENDPGRRDNPAHCMAVSPLPLERVDAQEIRDDLMEIFREVRYLHEMHQEL